MSQIWHPSFSCFSLNMRKRQTDISNQSNIVQHRGSIEHISLVMKYSQLNRTMVAVVFGLLGNNEDCQG